VNPLKTRGSPGQPNVGGDFMLAEGEGIVNAALQYALAHPLGRYPALGGLKMLAAPLWITHSHLRDSPVLGTTWLAGQPLVGARY